MTTRLTYAPKAYVFTKSSDGTLYNLSPYVTAGEIQLNINQVSSCTVTLRNPYKIFTTPSAGVAFHPQDPITVYLERLAGFPVRVFTGYLDTTPYYQLQPGVITLQASCALKRLLYTFFDPSLPYVIAFFEKYGWINTGSGSIISTAAFGNSGANQAQANSTTTLSDGSFGKLLWAILYDIGQWQDSQIWIEPIPYGIVDRMEALMKSTQAQENEAASAFSQFLSSIIGAGGQGSGGGAAGGAGGSGSAFTGGPLTSSSGLTAKGQPLNATQMHFANMILTIGQQLGASATACAVVMLQAIAESDIGLDMGWDLSNPTYGGLLAGSTQYFSSLGSASSDAVAQAEINSAFKGENGFNYPGGAKAITSSDIVGVAEQNSGAYTNGVPQYETEAEGEGMTIQQWAQEATNIVSAAQKNGGSVVGSAVSAAIGAVTSDVSAAITGVATTQSGSTAPSKGGGANATYTGYVNPFQGATLSAERIDMGVDYYANAGDPIRAIGNATVYSCQATGTGWPTSTNSLCYIGYTLNDGPLQGKNIYVAEIIAPAPGLAAGQTVKAGQIIATFMETGPTGLETGWAPLTADQSFGTLAASLGQIPPKPADSGSWASAAGLNFNAFLKSLGVVSGTPNAGGDGPNQSMPAGWPTSFGGIGAGTISAAASASSGTGTSSSGSTADGAQAFVGSLDFPSIEDQVTAIMLGSEGKGLMHDQSLMPFVQQVAQASMRSFMSLPNGDFYAFYPDYFGEMGQHDPYWYIDDLEILSGTISLSDNGLATHVYAVGDNTWPVNEELLNELFSAGTVTVYNAFMDESFIDTTNGRVSKKLTAKQKSALGITSSTGTPDPTGFSHGIADVMNANEAVDFVKRYGARPLVQNYPQVRSPIFEMLMAYQQFMTSWANQFLTPFEFTFMPELFPGGKVGFPSHGLMMYINQVTHTWDYTEGFTTTAELSSPSLLNGKSTNPDLPPNMVAALVEPIRKLTQKNAANIAAEDIVSSATDLSNAVQSSLSSIINSTGSYSTDPTAVTQHAPGA